MSVTYRTIMHEMEHEIMIKKSRFIAYVKPVKSEEEAKTFVDRIKKMHREATHNVPAYLIGANHEVQRYSDDGEPSGTAGLPVLEMLKKEGITDVAVVVTRYFGGVKLGTGGLVRAYTQSAKETIELAKVVDVEAYDLVEVSCEYGFHGKLQNFIESDYYIVADTIFQQNVVMQIYVKPSDVDDFLSKMVDMSNDQVITAVGGQDLLAVSGKEYIKIK